MKAWLKRGISLIIMFIVGIAAIVMGVIYFQYIARHIYEVSTNHLVEVYDQVNSSFDVFIQKNLGILDSCSNYIHMLGRSNSEDISGYIDIQRERWNFTDFYFISAEGMYMTLDGSMGYIDFGEALEILIDKKEPVMISDTLSSDEALTIFAAPTKEGRYNDFNYAAVAISYISDDMAGLLGVKAFSGESQCMIVSGNGDILLSTNGANIDSDNYLLYLIDNSDLDTKSLEKLNHDLENDVEGFVHCKIGGISYYITYQPVRFRKCMLIGVVSERVANRNLLSVQKGTIDVLIKVFLLLGACIITQIVYRNYKKEKISKLEIQYRDLMFNALSNSVDDIFIMINKDSWKVDYISPNVERLLGVEQKTVLQDIRNLAKSIVEGSNIISKEEFEAIPFGESGDWEREHVHQSTGERRWYKETVYHQSVQGVEKFLIVMSDRTQEKKMNENLQEALDAAKSANEAKSHFLSNMSHDIRTPMNAIVGLSVLLAKDAENPDKVREYTRKISSSSQHLLSLINDVLDMSKIESGKTSMNVAQFSLPELLEELNTIIMPQAKAKKQSFEIYVQGCIVEQLMGDKLRLNQILINLLSNAVKYTPDGGKIDFLVQGLPQNSSQYAQLRFVVKDNGIGMSEEFQKCVFDSFTREISSVTNSIQGTGLGMAITKNLVDLMGGIIMVESKLGEGSVFTVELSFAVPDVREDDNLMIRQKVTKVLVADDDEEGCLDIKEMMRGTGIEVSYVTSGADAVEETLKAKEKGEEFSVILLDWKMPGLSAIDTARQIREKAKTDIPILLLTSYDWGDIEDEARAGGIDAFMSKPFFVSTFWQTLTPLLSSETQGEDTDNATDENVLDGLLFLVAEDIELNAEIMSEMLAIEGAKCEFAVNGKEAVEIFTKSEPGHYDMILMDVQMPVMNGYDATRQIRASDHPEAKTIPIVAMTANAFAEDVQNALDAGMNGHLSKPVDMDAVKIAVGKFLEKK